MGTTGAQGINNYGNSLASRQFDVEGIVADDSAPSK